MADWAKMRTEYIAHGASYREIAKKYGVDQSTVARRGKAEGWVALREQNADKVQAKILKKIAENQANRANRLYAVTDKLLDRVESLLDAAEDIPAVALRNLAATLRDIKELQMIRSTLDEREQRAKVAAMERQLDRSMEDAGITVVIEGEASEFSV